MQLIQNHQLVKPFGPPLFSFAGPNECRASPLKSSVAWSIFKAGGCYTEMWNPRMSCTTAWVRQAEGLGWPEMMDWLHYQHVFPLTLRNEEIQGHLDSFRLPNFGSISGSSGIDCSGRWNSQTLASPRPARGWRAKNQQDGSAVARSCCRWRSWIRSVLVIPFEFLLSRISSSTGLNPIKSQFIFMN